MKIWALADPHLSLGIEGKKMDIFGENWINHPDKIKASCDNVIAPSDLLLIPGDLSWAMRADEAKVDLDFIASLPGIKIVCKGNHDYWWPSNKKLKEILPPSIHSVQNSVLNIGEFSIVGVRLWDNYEVKFDSIIDYKPNPKKNENAVLNEDEAERIFQKELIKLEAALKLLDQTKFKILLCHYPPVNIDLADSRASKLIEQYNVDLCVFGHLHNVKKERAIFGRKNNTTYVLASCDYLDFKPIQVFCD